uniref:N-acetylmuramoyl-L-alanine amidase family protein n=1 Tax=Methanosphaera sp. TaxID=2666342 RepID=UPI0025FC079D
LNDNVNEGILLDDIPVGKYFMFLRSTNDDEKRDDTYKYYVLKNNSEYKETSFYTFSNIGNKIVISSDDDYATLMMTVNKNNDDNIFDVVIDPGHGGMDSGASKNGYKETDFTMRAALSLKDKMEAYGVKVKLTREKEQLTLNETLPNYGLHGRAVIPHEVNAKYIFSLHLNSSNYSSANGLEIYTAQNINYDFAKKLVKNITENAKTNISKNPVNRVFDGVYTRTFTESDINSSIKEYKQKKMEPYDLTTKSNYYYMIRETGGIVTGAYVDNRNESVGENPYYNSNVGCETYLIEMGYITNKIDVENINNNLDKYTDAIANTFKTVFVK